MRAGRLDRTITIQRATATTVSAAGTPSMVWTALATMRAQIMQASTEEFFKGWGAGVETVVIFRTRFLDGLTPADRVIYDGVIHDIRELKEIGRRKGWEIRTVSHGQAYTPPEEPEGDD